MRVFLAILNVKAEGAGRQVIIVFLRTTPRRCLVSEHTAQENQPTPEPFHCISYGHTAR